MRADSPNWVVLGEPATPAEAAALEAFRELLPEDGMTKDSGSWVMRGGPLFWSFSWDEWCNKGMDDTALRLSAPNGQRLRIGGPQPIKPSPDFPSCQDRGQPSRLAPWP